MQIQEVITYAIIAISVGFVLINLFKTLFPSKDRLDLHGYGCSGGCNCDAKVMRKELLSKKFGIIK